MIVYSGMRAVVVAAVALVLVLPASAAAPISIAARPVEVTAYLDRVALYGVAGNRAGEQVLIEAKECDSYAPFRVAGGRETAAGGAWSTDAKSYFAPGVTTTYRARLGDQVSEPVTVRVHPQLFLRRLPAFFDLWIRAEGIFRGDIAAVQRRSGAQWKTIKRVRVKSFGGYAVGGEAKFTLKVRRGAQIRVVLSQAQIGRCFLPGFSNIVRA